MWYKYATIEIILKQFCVAIYIVDILWSIAVLLNMSCSNSNRGIEVYIFTVLHGE